MFTIGLLSLVLGYMNVSLEAAKKRGYSADEPTAGVSKLDAQGRLHAPDGKFKRRAKNSEIEADLLADEDDHTELVAAVAEEVLAPITAARAAEHQQRLVAAACRGALSELDILLAAPLTTIEMVKNAGDAIRKLPASSTVISWRRHVFIKLFDAEKKLSPVVAPAMVPIIESDESDEDDNEEEATPEVVPAPALPSVPASTPGSAAFAPGDEHLQQLIAVAQTGDLAQLKILLASDKTTVAIVNHVRAAVKGISRHILSNKLAVLTVLNQWKYQKLNDCHEKATDAVEPDGGTCFIS
ncbi:hypothetical protein FJ365_02335 [Candidatus Dependentiae bacterium]|nr:hypothetical protein [Candidatus Dependentiae bacterium]